MSRLISPENEVHQVTGELEGRDAEASAKPDVIEQVSLKLNSDIYLYSGILDKDGADRFILAAEENKSKENVILILTTHGGHADAAYRIARYLKRTYGKFALYVFGQCKSAGTLLALGADEIVMSCLGELGPLDVQIFKRDELLFRNSGLDISEALESINGYAFSIFQKQFLEIIRRSSGIITTKTAGEIASAITTGLLAPIAGQLDPLRIGEMQRAIRVASDYAERLNTNHITIKKLVEGYPSHSFVIDFDEAKSLFQNVRLTDKLELQLEQSLIDATMEGTGHDCIREPYPHYVAIVGFFKPDSENDDESEKSNNMRNSEELLSNERIGQTPSSSTDDDQKS